MKSIIKHTDDGSFTLFLPDMEEHYHSTKGARTESQHVFIDMGFKHSSAACPRILEIGFGTGLNALLTLETAIQSGKTVHYTTLELYPLEWDIVDKLAYTANPLFKKLHTCPWGEEVEIVPEFKLLKLKADFTTFVPSGLYDVVYFDAFAPEKQPEMWNAQLFDDLYVNISENGILTTYCAKGIIRRMLQQSGFKVERLPGPPGGKREILRAIKQLI